MKLRVLTLKNDEKEIEVDKSESILCLKKKICSSFPVFSAAENLKVIHSGKILADEQLIEDYTNIKDNDKIVVIAIKNVAKAAISTAGSNSSSSGCFSASSCSSKNSTISAGNSDFAKTEDKKTNEEEEKRKSKSDLAEEKRDEKGITVTEESRGLTEAGGEFGNSASVLLTGSKLEESIENIVSMGFQKTEVVAAMRAAYNNPDRAIDYLMNGLPTNLLINEDTANSGNTDAANTGDTTVARSSPPPISSTNLQTPAAGGEAEAVPGRIGGEGISSLSALRRDPFFNRFRAVLQTNSQLVPQLLAVIGEQNPQLLQMITDNQDEFIQMLQEPVIPSTSNQSDDRLPINESQLVNQLNQLSAQLGNAEEVRGGAPEVPAGANVFRLTPEETEAVAHLEMLGFSRDLAIEAYFACDKNVEMAANYLFETMNDYLGLDES